MTLHSPPPAPSAGLLGRPHEPAGEESCAPLLLAVAWLGKVLADVASSCHC